MIFASTPAIARMIIDLGTSGYDCTVDGVQNNLVGI